MDNLLVLYEVLVGQTREQALAQFEGKGYGSLKKAVAEAAIGTVARIRARYDDIRADDTMLDQILDEGARKAAAVANHTLHQVMQRLGLT